MLLSVVLHELTVVVCTVYLCLNVVCGVALSWFYRYWSVIFKFVSLLNFSILSFRDVNCKYSFKLWCFDINNLL